MPNKTGPAMDAINEASQAIKDELSELTDEKDVFSVKLETILADDVLKNDDDFKLIVVADCCDELRTNLRQLLRMPAQMQRWKRVLVGIRATLIARINKKKAEKDRIHAVAQADWKEGGQARFLEAKADFQEWKSSIGYLLTQLDVRVEEVDGIRRRRKIELSQFKQEVLEELDSLRNLVHSAAPHIKNKKWTQGYTEHLRITRTAA